MLSSAYLIGFYCFFKSILSFFNDQSIEAIITIKWNTKKKNLLHLAKSVEKKNIYILNHSEIQKREETREVYEKKTCSIFDDLLFQFIVIVIISCLRIDKFFHIEIKCFAIEKSKYNKCEIEKWILFQIPTHHLD